MLTGVILEEDSEGKLAPLTHATVRCLSNGLTRTTDSAGVFQLPCAVPVRLAISYVSYKTDTVSITSASDIKIILKMPRYEVVITSRNPPTYISSLSTFNTLRIGSVELTKAACCNLSESFETSPSVDVSYADAITGIKQIQLLGLAANYTQITTENTPEIRGLASIYGLGYVPGPWIEGIQVNKGTGSVANGYESIAGQINVEEIKPDKANKVFINSSVNEMGRLETPLHRARRINDRWRTALLTHADGVAAKSDRNQDGFLDVPTGRQLNVINRWRYAGTNGLFAHFAIAGRPATGRPGQF